MSCVLPRKFAQPGLHGHAELLLIVVIISPRLMKLTSAATTEPITRSISPAAKPSRTAAASEALTNVTVERCGQYLELIEPDDMPQNSDMVLSLKQVLTALEGFKRKYYQDYEWSALSDDDEEEEDS